MNKELAAYITHLCELSGHTTRIEDEIILVKPGEGYTDVYEAFTMVKEYYAFGYFERYSFSGSYFGSASFEIFKKFAIMHFAADIRAAHQLPPLNLPPVTDAHPGFSIEFHEPTSYLLTSKASPIPTTYTIFSPNALVSLSYLMGTSSEDLLSLVLEPSGAGYTALFQC
ncbi:Imm61 family immunity protein [Pauljensenia sp. UMB3104]|uniref:Imm61 family immunity protein n=1 Tax=Pauljensenia sp. UMB3104 TaxID=3046331 RepID=UPI00254DF503|nr:Imm61 family immunity protein [Pauljensenia sp. UMB3104]MDK7160244.1 Imm61 family immunity protein [Pauljensenia sp. UMB3104]